jgi:hypothetical protein
MPNLSVCIFYLQIYRTGNRVELSELIIDTLIIRFY